MKIQKYLSASPIFALNLAYERVVSNINRELKKENLNLLQGLVLTALFFEENDTITPSNLAKIFCTSRGNMSHILSHLEYKGWVKRRVNSKDARQFQIILKAEGKKKALKIIKYYDKLQNYFEKHLGILACKSAVENIHSLVEAYTE